MTPAEELARYVRPDELHTTFNFDALMASGPPSSQRHVIDLTLAQPARSMRRRPGCWPTTTPPGSSPGTAGPHRDALHRRRGRRRAIRRDRSRAARQTDVELGRRRARAAALLELALPGSAYVYQGDELGLEEVENLPDELLQDPTWERSGYTVARPGRLPGADPVVRDRPPFGFGSAEHPPWLPQPAHWADLTVAAQEATRRACCTLYRTALAERRRNPALGDGSLQLGRGHAGRGSVVHPRARLPLRGELRAGAVRAARGSRCWSPPAIRPVTCSGRTRPCGCEPRSPAERLLQKKTSPEITLTTRPPIHTSSPSRSMCTRPTRPRTVPWEAM